MNDAPSELQMIAVSRFTPLVAVALADDPVLDVLGCRMLVAAFELLELFELDVDVDPIPGDLDAIAAQAAELAVTLPTLEPILAAIASLSRTVNDALPSLAIVTVASDVSSVVGVPSPLCSKLMPFQVVPDVESAPSLVRDARCSTFPDNDDGKLN